MYDSEEEHDFTKLRYALYARKSTDDPQRQVRSINDQIAECQLLADRLGIKVVRPIIRETKSAKKPGKRPAFTQMLKDIKSGKYNGILAWHPDRLARNMKEGGELIDMVDEYLLKDLKFVTHHFTNDANGKMLLGMSFVLSKQYSDDLSQKVTRGMRRSFAEGKSSGTPKNGYVRDEDGLYRPDGKNFELVCEAWQMRKNEASLKDIADFMNEEGYGRAIKNSKGKKVIKMSDKRLSDIFKDSFYYGVLVQAKQTVDLREVYDFEPVVSEEDYNLVQKLSHRRLTPLNRNRATYYPLRGMVICSFCKSIMYPGASSSRSKKRYLYYRCDNKACARKKKSIRAKVIFNWLFAHLEDGLGFTEKEYEHYLIKLNEHAGQTRIKLQTNIKSNQGAIKSIDQEINERSLKIIEYDKGSTVWKINNEKIEELAGQKEALQEEVTKLKAELTDPEQDRLSIDQFLNLSQNASAKLKAANEIGKDRITRWIYLNLLVDEEKVVDFQMKDPFATLSRQRKILNGRGDRT